MLSLYVWNSTIMFCLHGLNTWTLNASKYTKIKNVVSVIQCFFSEGNLQVLALVIGNDFLDKNTLITEVSICVHVSHSHVCYAFWRMWTSQVKTFCWLQNKLFILVLKSSLTILQLSQTWEQSEPQLHLWSFHTDSPVPSWRFPAVRSVTVEQTSSLSLMPPPTGHIHHNQTVY